MPGDSATATLTLASLFAGDRSNSLPLTIAVHVADPAAIGCKTIVKVRLALGAREPNCADQRPDCAWTADDPGRPCTERTWDAAESGNWNFTPVAVEGPRLLTVPVKVSLFPT